MAAEPRARSVERGAMCSRVTAERSCDPIGHALDTHRSALLELAKPWASSGYRSPKMPPEVSKLIGDYFASRHAAYVEGGVEMMRRRGLDMGIAYIAPDREYSKPGHTRLMVFTKPDPPFARYHRREWLVPDADLPAFIAALLAGSAALDGFAAHEVNAPGTRDIIVCTQGNVDTCCATFGYPIYRQMRRHAARSGGKVRVWEATHFQYHRYAPVALDLPGALHWGQLRQEDLQTLVLRDGPLASLHDRYMGWSGAGTDPFAQAAEREAMVREGWEWLSYTRSIESVSKSPRGDSATVRISFRSDDGAVSGSYEAVVEVTGTVTLPVGCFYPEESAEVKQYDVTSIRRFPGAG